jgi:hypothetical protein
MMYAVIGRRLRNLRAIARDEGVPPRELIDVAIDELVAAFGERQRAEGRATASRRQSDSDADAVRAQRFGRNVVAAQRAIDGDDLEVVWNGAIR